MPKQTTQDIIDKYSLADKTSVDMDKLIEPTGLRGRAIWSKIRTEKLLVERKAAKLAKFQGKSLDYDVDDLVELNGIIGFDFSTEVIKEAKEI